MYHIVIFIFSKATEERVSKRERVKGKWRYRWEPSIGPVPACHPSCCPHTVTGNQSQLRAVLQEDIPGSLAGVDANAVISDDGRGCRRYFEFLSSKLQHSSEGRVLRNIEYFVGQLGI